MALHSGGQDAAATPPLSVRRRAWRAGGRARRPPPTGRPAAPSGHVTGRTAPVAAVRRTRQPPGPDRRGTPRQRAGRRRHRAATGRTGPRRPPVVRRRRRDLEPAAVPRPRRRPPQRGLAVGPVHPRPLLPALLPPRLPRTARVAARRRGVGRPAGDPRPARPPGRTAALLPVLPARRRRGRRLRRADPRPARTRAAPRAHRGAPRHPAGTRVVRHAVLAHPRARRLPDPAPAARRPGRGHHGGGGRVHLVPPAPVRHGDRRRRGAHVGRGGRGDTSAPADTDGALRAVSRTLRRDTALLEACWPVSAPPWTRLRTRTVSSHRSTTIYWSAPASPTPGTPTPVRTPTRTAARARCRRSTRPG
jgi:hypothetical protein